MRKVLTRTAVVAAVVASPLAFAGTASASIGIPVPTKVLDTKIQPTNVLTRGVVLLPEDAPGVQVRPSAQPQVQTLPSGQPQVRSQEVVTERIERLPNGEVRIRTVEQVRRVTSQSPTRAQTSESPAPVALGAPAAVPPQVQANRFAPESQSTNSTPVTMPQAVTPADPTNQPPGIYIPELVDFIQIPIPEQGQSGTEQSPNTLPAPGSPTILPAPRPAPMPVQ